MPVLNAVIPERARDAIREFPEDVRNRVGFAMFEIQMGRSVGMPLCRPMGVVALGVRELRVRKKGGAFRVFFVEVTHSGVPVFHALQKKMQQTPFREFELG